MQFFSGAIWHGGRLWGVGWWSGIMDLQFGHGPHYCMGKEVLGGCTELGWEG